MQIDFGRDTGGAGKCHQRWRNLEKMYRGHCRYMKSTGTGKEKPPKYFDEMHELIGEKHSSQPINLLDSLDNFNSTTSDTCSSEIIISNEVTEDDNEKLLDMEVIASKKNKDSNSRISNIFENIKKSVKPKKDNLSIVLKELHAHDVQIENERFGKFQTLLTEQNE
ncbi:unnamed protein product [Lasius platythorax]|uniref:MADF domain-containing protein n=2 Tax=Lasius platythorax TaxID=488582 RepID=A0AAV2N3Y6_9HYME